MGKVKRSTLLGLGLLLLYVGGCKVSCTTANVSSFKLSKDEKGTVQTKEFAPGDTIYAIATVSNNGSKVTLKFSTVAEKVEGMADNTSLPNFDTSLDVEGDNYATYRLIPKGNGWPAGRYRIDVVMLYNGEQKDKKSDTFTVKGSSPAAAPSPAAQTPKGEATPAEEEEEDGSENSNSHSEH